MRQALTVQKGQSLCYLLNNGFGLVLAEGLSLVEELPQGLLAEVLHYQVDLPSIIDDFYQLDDSGMVDPTQDGDFILDVELPLLVVQLGLIVGLDDHLRTVPGVYCYMDFGERPLANLMPQLVVVDHAEPLLVDETHLVLSSTNLGHVPGLNSVLAEDWKWSVHPLVESLPFGLVGRREQLRFAPECTRQLFGVAVGALLHQYNYPNGTEYHYTQPRGFLINRKRE